MPLFSSYLQKRTHMSPLWCKYAIYAPEFHEISGKVAVQKSYP